jgi:hypothetical protein
MVKLGYKLSSEEQTPPADLVHYARMAEETGFSCRAHLGSFPIPGSTPRVKAHSSGA